MMNEPDGHDETFEAAVETALRNLLAQTGQVGLHETRTEGGSAQQDQHGC